MANIADIIPGKLVGIYISTNLVTPAYKEVVCGQDVGTAGTKDVQVTATKCGTAKSTGPVSWTITGTGLANHNPNASSELSADDLAAIMQGDDDVLIKIAHISDATLHYRQGRGQMTAYNERAGVNDNVLFDFTIEINGELVLVSP